MCRLPTRVVHIVLDSEVSGGKLAGPKVLSPPLSGQCAPPRMHSWQGKHWHCSHQVSSLRCALACTVAGNQGKECVAACPQLADTIKSPMATCGGATRIQLRASARRAVKVLIPLIMETPWVGRCTWMQGVVRACARGRHTCLEERVKIPAHARVGLLNIKTDNRTIGQIYFTVT